MPVFTEVGSVVSWFADYRLPASQARRVLGLDFKKTGECCLLVCSENSIQLLFLSRNLLLLCVDAITTTFPIRSFCEVTKQRVVNACPVRAANTVRVWLQLHPLVSCWVSWFELFVATTRRVVHWNVRACVPGPCVCYICFYWKKKILQQMLMV